MPSFRYSKVETGSLVSGGNKFIKYKVVDETTGGSITVKQWAELLANDNKNAASRQLTRLLRQKKDDDDPIAFHSLSQLQKGKLLQYSRLTGGPSRSSSFYE